MALGLAANTPLSNSVKSPDMRPTSRTITSLLAAVSAAFAVSAMIGAPIADAQVCTPSQVWLNGECTYPPELGGPPPEQRKPRLDVHGPCLPSMAFECCSPGPTIPCPTQ